MGFRNKINRLIKPLTGYYVGKARYGADLWHDAVSLCGPRAGIVFDVGANEGESALNFMELFPDATIYSFEPLPESYASLESMARPRARLVPINAALGADHGSAVLNQNALQTTSSMLPTAPSSRSFLSGPALSTQRRVKISVTTLDAVAAEYQVETIDLLKIDVQGYELEVLKGASQMLSARRIRVIVLEVNFAPLYERQASFQDISTFLQSHGFSLSCLYDFAFSTRKELMWCEALFCRSD